MIHTYGIQMLFIHVNMQQSILTLACMHKSPIIFPTRHVTNHQFTFQKLLTITHAFQH